MITVERTTLDGVLLIKPAAFEDHRAEYVELYNEELYRNHGISARKTPKRLPHGWPSGAWRRSMRRCPAARRVPATAR